MSAAYSKTMRDQARAKRRKARADRRERLANNDDQMAYLLHQVNAAKAAGGGVVVLNHQHDAGCLRPSGGPCSCADQPALQVLDPDTFLARFRAAGARS